MASASKGKIRLPMVKESADALRGTKPPLQTALLAETATKPSPEDPSASVCRMMGKEGETLKKWR